MIQKILLSLAVVSSLYSLDIVDESKLNNFDLGLFVGSTVGYAYNQNNELDDGYYDYSLYMGLPIDGMEFIVKKKLQRSQDYNGWLQSVSINFPIGGKYSREWYMGLSAGESKLNFTDSSVIKNDLKDKEFKEPFYGIHFGKRFKYTRNFYVRAEMEYLHYDYAIETNSATKYDMLGSLGFNYGVEWRF